MKIGLGVKRSDRWRIQPLGSPFGVNPLVENSRMIVLKIAYDDSDLMTDYFSRDRPFEEYMLTPLDGKVITEAKLRQALKFLPEWIRNNDWKFQKGEKYSMSDHPYGQLRVDTGIGATIKSQSSGCEVGMCFIVTATYLSTFEMNHSVDKKIPESLDILKAQIKAKQEAEEKRREEMKPKIVEAEIKTIESSHAVIDGQGFRVLTPQLKKELKQKVINDFLAENNLTPEGREVLQEAEAVARYLKKTPPYVS